VDYASGALHTFADEVPDALTYDKKNGWEDGAVHNDSLRCE
jgi:hypothetical protein